MKIRVRSKFSCVRSSQDLFACARARAQLRGNIASNTNSKTLILRSRLHVCTIGHGRILRGVLSSNCPVPVAKAYKCIKIRPQLYRKTLNPTPESQTPNLFIATSMPSNPVERLMITRLKVALS